MSHTMHSLDLLAETQATITAKRIVLFGDEPFLKRLAREAIIGSLLGETALDSPPSIFPGDTALWRDVRDELSTASLFGGGTQRVAIVEDADKFVTANRSTLEDVAPLTQGGTLVLEVSAWPANTRLYKLIDQHGLQIDCRVPETTRGKSKSPDEDRMREWIMAWGASRHDIRVEQRAARLLLELVGPVFGMLDQDLAKLALYVPAGGKITPELVRDIVGGWRTQTAWDMIDAAVEGRTAEALVQLDRLLQSDDHPIAIFGQLSWSLRRYNAAVRAYEAAERSGRRITLQEALKLGGFHDWPKGTLEAAEKRLKHLTRERAGTIYRKLLETDLALKGTHSHESRARFALEHLFFSFTDRTVKKT